MTDRRGFFKMLAGVPFLGLLAGRAESVPLKKLEPLDCGVSTRSGSVSLSDDSANDQVTVNHPNLPPGALHGDGIHDDTAAIQSLVHQAAKQDDCFSLPPGTYRITDTLYW